MKAVVFHGIGDIRLDNVKEPSIKRDFDAIVCLTASAICATDLHFVPGTVPGMQEGSILGHESVGVVEVHKLFDRRITFRPSSPRRKT